MFTVHNFLHFRLTNYTVNFPKLNYLYSAYYFQSVLPPTTFVSAEAVLWLMEHVEVNFIHKKSNGEIISRFLSQGIESEEMAISKLDDMVTNNMIRHASGDTTHKFVYGFYLFYLLSSDKEQVKHLANMRSDDILYYRFSSCRV